MNRDGVLSPSDSLVEESKRLLSRYVNEVVLPLNLCPWAAPALARNEVETQILIDPWSMPHDAERAARAVRDALLHAASDANLVLLVLPRLTATRLEMDDLLRAVRTLGNRTFALAAFHPEAPAETTTGERFIPYLRRSPDPLLQAVRQTTLDRTAAQRPSGTTFLDLAHLASATIGGAPPIDLRARIAEDNLHRVREFGIERLEAILQDIHADRRRSRQQWEARATADAAPTPQSLEPNA